MAVYESGPHMMERYQMRGAQTGGRTLAMVESVDGVVDAAAEQQIGVLSSGVAFGVDGSGKFAYLDTEAHHLGMILEVIEPPTSLGEPLRRL